MWIAVYLIEIQHQPLSGEFEQGGLGCGGQWQGQSRVLMPCAEAGQFVCIG